MRAMTARTRGRLGRTHLVAHAVDAGGVLRGGFFVTGGALGGSELRRMLGLLDVGVAIDAIEFGVDRFRKNLRPHADPLRREALFAGFELRFVAVHAFAVRHHGRLGGGRSGIGRASGDRTERAECQQRQHFGEKTGAQDVHNSRRRLHQRDGCGGVDILCGAVANGIFGVGSGCRRAGPLTHIRDRRDRTSGCEYPARDRRDAAPVPAPHHGPRRRRRRRSAARFRESSSAAGKHDPRRDPRVVPTTRASGRRPGTLHRSLLAPR